MSLPTFGETTGLVGQSRSAYAALLKEYYADMWDLHVHTRGIVMSTIGSKKGRMGGRRVVAAFVDELPQSAGISLLEGVRLPTPSVGNYANPTIPARGLFTTLRWTVEVELAARAGNKAAFARPRRMDVKHAREQFDIQMDRKAYSGKYDILGVVSGPDTGTSPNFVIPLHPRNDRTSSGSASYYAGHHHMRKNKHISFIDSTEGAGGGPVSSISQTDPSATLNAVQISAKGGTTDAPTITVSTDPATLHGAELADGDLIVEYGNRRGVAADLPGQQEAYATFNGLDDIATDSTRYANIYGLSKTTYPTLSGVYDNNGGTVRPYREARIMLIVDRINDEGTGNSPDVLLTNRAVRREVVNEHDGDRRYAPVITKSGFGQLVAHVGDVALPIKSDWNCPPGLMWAVRKSTFGWCTLADMQPVDQQYERFVQGLAAHEMLWHKHGNIWCPQPFDNGCIDDIEFDVYALQGE